MDNIRAQIHRNAVALISLVIATTSLAYSTWRNETTEEQRNIRHASFRVLEALGELQEISDFRHYYLPRNPSVEREGELRVRGFGHVALVSDLMELMPHPAPRAGRALDKAWQDSVNSLGVLTKEGQHSPAAARAEHRITQAIRGSRKAVLDVLQSLE
jgi:hypothetical protein